MGNWNVDRHWGTHKTEMLVSKVFPQVPVEYLNLTLAAQTSYFIQVIHEGVVLQVRASITTHD